MVLADLGRRINSALNDFTSRSPKFDEKALDALLKEICSALLESDVNVKLVANLRTKVKAKVLPQLQASQNVVGGTGVSNREKQLIQKAVFDELVALVDPGENAQPAFKPVKGKIHVVMFVGLQGSGKTTSCTKLAVYYQRRGFRTCLVCADTFRAGAFDQLKQNATKAKVPFFGSYTESDPRAISSAGVAKFRAERFDIIIVDTSGRHRQESELFKEMVEISEAVQPNLTIMVLDGAIGQAAESQSKAFKEAAGFAAIIVTKMDGHAKGGGAISAVAATKTPIMFIGTGEHIHDLEKFVPGPFISKMLGMGDLTGLMEHVQDMQTAGGLDAKEKREQTMKRMEQGIFTIRDMRDQLSNVMSMGPLSKLASMIPGMSDMLNAGGSGSEEDASKRMKRLLYIMDAMTTDELDSDGSIFQNAKKGTLVSKSEKASGKVRDKNASATPLEAMTNLPEGQPRSANKRVLKVARGSGTSVREVEELLAQHQTFAAMVKQAGGKQGFMAKAQQAQSRAGAGRGMFSPAQLAQAQQRMQSMGMGGMDLQSMMRSMGGGGGGSPGGGGGGMPDMAALQRMAQQMGLGGMLGR
ncbi:MAG: Signal recognition particle [Cyphobasidiales sp. Tagirdzhanova-0007]|nr:MAG: Signal recognition particle [Cyphobasidiales sp. Tagirdzhanova-0007]